MTSRRALGLGLAFAAGAACGWLVARGTAAEPAPGSAASVVTDAPPDAGPPAPSADSAAASKSRARRPGAAAGEADAPAFPGVRREPSSAGPPPPPAPQSEPAPQTAAAPLPAEAEALVAIIERAARSGAPLDPAAAERVNRAAVAIANLNPLPRLSLETIRALDLVHQDAANTVYPAVSSAEILAELEAMLAGTSAPWGDAHRTDVWLIRFASLAAEQGTLSRAVAERLVASDDPWARAAAVEIAASHDLIDRARLRALIRDPDADVRSVAFSRFVETTPVGDETAALDEVRSWLNSDRDDPKVALSMLPELGPGGAVVAEEAVRAGGLAAYELHLPYSTLIVNGRLDSVPRDVLRGPAADDLLSALEDYLDNHGDAAPAMSAFLRRSALPDTAAMVDRCVLLALASGDADWVQSIVRDSSHPVAARSLALERLAESPADEHSDVVPGLIASALRNRAEPAEYRRYILGELLVDYCTHILVEDATLLALVRDVAVSDPNAHVRRAAREAIQAAEREIELSK